MRRLLTLAAALAVAAATLTGCGGTSDTPQAAFKAYFATRVPASIGEVSYDPNGGNRALVTRVGPKWEGGTGNSDPRNGQVDGGYASAPSDFDEAYSRAVHGDTFDTAIPFNHYSGKWTIAAAQ
jgi:hypothetical protein